MQQITTKMHYWFKNNSEVINSRQEQLTTEFKNKSSTFKHELQTSITRTSSSHANYRKNISSYIKDLAEVHSNSKRLFLAQLSLTKTSILNTEKFLYAQNPETILQKGYVIVSSDNQTIKSANMAQQHKTLNLEFIDGKISVINEDYE